MIPTEQEINEVLELLQKYGNQIGQEAQTNEKARLVMGMYGLWFNCRSDGVSLAICHQAILDWLQNKGEQEWNSHRTS